MTSYFNKIFVEVFYVLAVALVIFAILELVHPGLVLAYININWILIFWLIIGMVILLTGKEKHEKGNI